ncbi:hypothetical protein WR25_08380 [Diploscapter pachys]|uniref:HMA domain-containing protein n=1 Tax=Diploscapter pachys TaxID=2018661 RepID=A0A2A2JNW4_9BILA|nr:hypothetical protein WR25_08380 [Diploscapter pachys]
MDDVNLLDDSPLLPRLPPPPRAASLPPQQQDNRVLAGNASSIASYTSLPSSSNDRTSSDDRMKYEAIVEIKGMTCHACVNNIQDHISSKPGIYSIFVSLEEEQGRVVYDPLQWTGDKIAEAIDDMGFDANLKTSYPAPKSPVKFSTDSSPSQKTVQLTSGGMEEAVVSIEGMTCHACVNNIQDNIGAKQGIVSIKVDLQQKKGWVKYYTNEWTGEKVAEAIDDMGFDVKLISANDINDTESVMSDKSTKSNGTTHSRTSNLKNGKPKTTEKIQLQVNGVKYSKGVDNLEKCVVSIEGMTCASCVQYIERNLSKVEGVQSVVVALIAAQGEINFDPSLLSVDRILDEIASLGYKASLLDSNYNRDNHIQFLIGGLNSETDVTRVESHLIARKGVDSCHVSLATSIASVEFSPSLIGPRDVIQIIEGLGYTAELASRDDQMRRLDHTEEVKKWRTTFMISLLCGVPVMLIMIIFHWILHTPMHPERQTPVFTPALSLDNFLLFLLCTPVQVFGGRQFYTAAYKALKHGTANMDVLIVLATSIAYAYSIIVLLAAIFLRWSSSPMTFFDVPPMLIVFIALGRMLENKAKANSRIYHFCKISKN